MGVSLSVAVSVGQFAKAAVAQEDMKSLQLTRS